MSTYEYVDAAGRAHTLVASSRTLAIVAAFRFEHDRTHDLALADMAAGTVEAKS